MSRVLIIDDSKVERLYASAALTEAGHEVLEADDGASGIERARRDAPDCILLDLVMPDMSGQDVLVALEAEGLKIPVIVVTGTLDDHVVQQCIELGAHRVIDKPDSPAILVEAVREALVSH